MPRKTRIEYSGAVYHVLNRGDRRQAILSDEEDWRRSLGTLEDRRVAKRLQMGDATRASRYRANGAPLAEQRLRRKLEKLEKMQICMD